MNHIYFSYDHLLSMLSVCELHPVGEGGSTCKRFNGADADDLFETICIAYTNGELQDVLKRIMKEDI